MRLKNYDYNTPGAYFITICTKDKRSILSRIAYDTPVGAAVPVGPHAASQTTDVGVDVPGDAHSVLTNTGRIVDETLREMESFYPNVSLERYVIMPNHIHMLINISGDGTPRTSSPTNATIPAFVSYFKRRTDRQSGDHLWQRSFYDHIVRNQSEYNEIAEYIDANPSRWLDDRFYDYAQ